MAKRAIGAKLTGVRVNFGVAGVAINRSACEDTVHVAACTWNGCVTSLQYKHRQVVVIRGGNPTGGSMTSPAINPKLAAMSIIFIVA